MTARGLGQDVRRRRQRTRRSVAGFARRENFRRNEDQHFFHRRRAVCGTEDVFAARNVAKARKSRIREGAAFFGEAGNDDGFTAFCEKRRFRLLFHDVGVPLHASGRIHFVLLDEYLQLQVRGVNHVRRHLKTQYRVFEFNVVVPVAVLTHVRHFFAVFGVGHLVVERGDGGGRENVQYPFAFHEI